MNSRSRGWRMPATPCTDFSEGGQIGTTELRPKLSLDPHCPSCWIQATCMPRLLFFFYERQVIRTRGRKKHSCGWSLAPRSICCYPCYARPCWQMFLGEMGGCSKLEKISFVNHLSKLLTPPCLISHINQFSRYQADLSPRQ